ncbi:rhodanese-like domain-containing protein [Actinomycetospora sp. NBRC 106375]|uniref:rhodanese-like domain-containing protein n=1 Tax=Actinomycetospora sp. NBRC 106375 TaxID=3032207 RepID=UPI002556D12D|nr:rhodanese-like domain-containing protein [Actinomycetospora sp. NBRC 106375]
MEVVSHPGLPSVVPGEIPAGSTLLDVREDDEWVAGHAPEAVHLPMSQLTARLDEVPAGPLAVVCKVGGRSAQVTAFLAQRGHEVVNVSGGMLAWEAEGRPMTSEGPGPAAVV